MLPRDSTTAVRRRADYRPPAFLVDALDLEFDLVPDATFGLEECQTWFEERGVAKFKTPERIVVVDEIPMMAAGKADRQALRAML